MNLILKSWRNFFWRCQEDPLPARKAQLDTLPGEVQTSSLGETSSICTIMKGTNLALPLPRILVIYFWIKKESAPKGWLLGKLLSCGKCFKAFTTKNAGRSKEIAGITMLQHHQCDGLLSISKVASSPFKMLNQCCSSRQNQRLDHNKDNSI